MKYEKTGLDRSFKDLNSIFCDRQDKINALVSIQDVGNEEEMSCQILG